MYDTLWIGCSHSAGLYNNKNVIISPDNGIASRLAASLQEKWKILAIRGEGMHTYMECIKVLDNNGTILCDDYNLSYAPGVKKAIDEYVKDNNYSCEILRNSRFAKIEKKK